MKLRKSQFFTLVLLAMAIGIHMYSQQAVWVENQYTNAVYPLISRVLRYLFGWLPFSFGDILYGMLIVWLIWKLTTAIRFLIKRQLTPKQWLVKTGRFFRCLLIIYIIFNLFWGINYNRVGIAGQLNLAEEMYRTDDLKKLNGLLVSRANAAKLVLKKNQVPYPDKKELFQRVQQAYADATQVYPFLQYTPHSLKPSIWSWVGNYMGFTGYYNPFTGEAQVNTLVPKFLQPFTTCHEVAHQLGYAKEMEANFVGYLVATASQDTLLHYSVYLDLFMYSNRNLFQTDSVTAKLYQNNLIPEIKTDLAAWKAFNRKHKNPIEPVFRWVYGKYLEGNQQPKGVLSYDEVTGLVIAWYKKTGNL